MMEINRSMPKLRFKKFENDTWLDKTLGDYGYFYYGTSAPKWSISKSGKTPCVRYGELYTKYNEIIKEIHSYTNMPIEKLKFSTGSEVLIPRVGEDPKDFANCSWLSLPNVAIGEMISVYNTEQDPLFTAYMFNAKLKYEFAKRVEGGNVSNLYYSYLENIIVAFPTKLEQQKIGEFFKVLDERIANQERKISKVKALKEAYLTEMFPQEGETVPKRRFKGFNDEWVTIKLREIGKSTSGTSIENEFVQNGKYKVISIGSYSEESKYVDQGLRVNLNDKTRSRLLNKDDLTMVLNDKTAQGNILGRVLLIDRNNTYIYNQRTQRIELNTEEHCPQFFYHMLNAPFVRGKIINNSQGNTQIYINFSFVEELEYIVPSKLEQQKIGEFFKNLDDQIRAEEAKLEKLKKMKEAYLEEMFV